MLVMKFGGTSLGSAESIGDVVDAVLAERARRPLVVVSAHAGITDLLESALRRAAAGEVDLGPVQARHAELLQGLGLASSLLDDLHAEARDQLRGLKLVGAADARARDRVLAFGELCSARVVAAFFEGRGVPARALPAWEAGLRTDSQFGRARPLRDDGRIAARLAEIDQIPVVTGFVAMDQAGQVTTLGRNGSDYSAALFGQAVAAEEIQIWTDVDGVMTADPRLVPDARLIPCMSFDEAAELAYHGGRVLHPASLQPALDAGIPVRVRNTQRPEHPGTAIVVDPGADAPPVRAVVHRRGVELVTLEIPRQGVRRRHALLAEVFGLASAHEVDVELLVTSDASLTMTSSGDERLRGFAAGLGRLGAARHEGGYAMVTVVGSGLATRSDAAARVLAVLAEAGVAARVISQGAVRVSLAVLIDEAQLDRAVRELHAAFFAA